VQIGVSVVAVVVKAERLALTVAVTLCQCCEMDVKEEQSVAIKFCCKVNFSATKTVELIQKAYGDAVLSRTTIFEWHKRFREGRESVKDDESSGRPTTSRTDDNIAAVDKMVKEDGNVTSRLIAGTRGIPKPVVLRILRGDLKKRKLCSRFVPHALTREQMYERVAACQDLLNMINGDKNFLDKFITGDESWCFACDPETKCQGSEWVGEHSPGPKKLRFQKSKVKTMLIVFFDKQGIVHKEFVQEGCTVNAEYYKGVSDHLISRIRRVRSALYRMRDFFLLHDNAPGAFGSKNSTLSDSKTSSNIESPPYSPDLSSPDYVLFPKVKLQLKGARFDTTEEIQKAVTDQLNQDSRRRLF